MKAPTFYPKSRPTPASRGFLSFLQSRKSCLNQEDLRRILDVWLFQTQTSARDLLANQGHILDRLRRLEGEELAARLKEDMEKAETKKREIDLLLHREVTLQKQALLRTARRYL
jgi:hypothetical protein